MCLLSGSVCTCDRCDSEGLRGSELLLPLWGGPRPISKNLLNEVTDGESPPPQMGGEGRGRAEPGPDKRRGGERKKGGSRGGGGR